MFKKFLKGNLGKIILSMVLITIPTIIVYLQADNLKDGIALEVSDNGGSYTFVRDIIENYAFYLYMFNYVMMYIKYRIDKKSVISCNNQIVETCDSTKNKISRILLWIIPALAVVVNVVFYILYRK